MNDERKVSDSNVARVGMDCIVHLRMSAAKKRQLSDAARRMGLTVSEYTRRRLQGRIAQHGPQMDTVRELRQIGVALRHVAATRESGDRVSDLLDQVGDLIGRLSREL